LALLHELIALHDHAVFNHPIVPPTLSNHSAPPSNCDNWVAVLFGLKSAFRKVPAIRFGRGAGVIKDIRVTSAAGQQQQNRPK
jgi:hypothetical protein